MKTPPLLLGAALLFWGWQTGYWIAAVAMAAVLESSQFLKLRWEFTDRDLTRLANLCAVFLVGAALFASTSTQAPAALREWLGSPSSLSSQSTAANQTAQAMLTVLQWSPMIAFLFMAAQAFNRREEIGWSTVFGVLRLRAVRNWRPEWARRTLNFTYPYFAVCVLAACIGQPEAPPSFLGLGLLLAWALWRERSRRFGVPVWAGAIGAALLLGFLGHRGLVVLNAQVSNYNPDWFTEFFQGRADAKESRTSIGSVGRLKLSGRIVLRVEPKTGPTPPALLREASYSDFRSPTWHGAGGETNFQALQPTAEDTTWILRPRSTNTTRVTIAGYLNGGRGLLALPNGAARLENLPATAMQTNRLGVVRVNPGPGFVMFDCQYGSAPGIDSAPANEDRQVPEKEKAAVAQLATELNLAGQPPPQALNTIRTFFTDHYSYSLRLAAPPRGQTNETPLALFLLRDRAGHCEYFATAATLLLRQAGIPARYAVGYAVQEPSGRGFVVRQRHAHAWCLVYLDGAWQDFDPTPASWSEREAANASAFEFLSDALSRLWFEFTKFRYGQSGIRKYLLWLVVPLVGLSLWRLLVGKQWKRFRQERKPAAARSSYPGLDSELYLIEQTLARQGLVRSPGEHLSAWLRRARTLPVLAVRGPDIETLLRLHYRYRFDPAGISPSERENLRTQARSCLQALLRK